jgi:peptide/nickel transport system permease protein
VSAALPLALLTAIGASLLVFVLLNFLPGDVTDVLSEESSLTTAQRARLRTDLGLDEPVQQRYWEWATGIVRLDFGRSMLSQEPVRDIIARTFPRTMTLAIMSFLIACAFGLSAGVAAAVFHHRPLDYLVRGSGALLISVPSFWSGTVLIIVLVNWTGWSPPTEYKSITSDPLSCLRQLALPALIIGLTEGAILAKLVRSSVMQQLDEDYVRTARAKGVAGSSVLRRHVLRNAMLPIFTLMSVMLTNSLAGSVIMERVFNIPGMGSLLLRSVVARDYPVVLATVMLVVVLVIVINFVTDFCYHLFDPRVRT